jgi:hypothetical protein
LELEESFYMNEHIEAGEESPSLELNMVGKGVSKAILP